VCQRESYSLSLSREREKEGGRERGIREREKEREKERERERVIPLCILLQEALTGSSESTVFLCMWFLSTFQGSELMSLLERCTGMY
jgi:hypothetical protein